VIRRTAKGQSSRVAGQTPEEKLAPGYPGIHTITLAHKPGEGGPTMKITQLQALRVRIPQKPPIAPYQNRYRAGTHKESLLIRLETATALVGWGETPDDWINKSFEGTAEEQLHRQVVGRDPFDLEAFYAENTLGSYLASGVEMACWDLIGRATRQPLYKLLGGRVRSKVELAACM